ncbi:hypothetical protein J6590_065060 [Homalodisca vitripennis]|nr:hypothetical protein J6590_065060 [Homalodisca vitripennis]
METVRLGCSFSRSVIVGRWRVTPPPLWFPNPPPRRRAVCCHPASSVSCGMVTCQCVYLHCIYLCARLLRKQHNHSKDLNPLINRCKLIPCSSSEYERSFSHMNVIISPSRSRLTIRHVSALMFIKLNGPNIRTWKPKDYVRT